MRGWLAQPHTEPWLGHSFRFQRGMTQIHDPVWWPAAFMARVGAGGWPPLTSAGTHRGWDTARASGSTCAAGDGGGGGGGAVAALPGLSPPGSVCSGCDLEHTKAAFCYAIAYFEFLSRGKANLVCLRHLLQVTALHMHIAAQWQLLCAAIIIEAIWRLTFYYFERLLITLFS